MKLDDGKPPPVDNSHQLLNLIPVEESLDIAFLELVELRGQWLCDNGINQLLLTARSEVMYLCYSFLDEFAQIGRFGGVDNGMIKALYKPKFCYLDVS